MIIIPPDHCVIRESIEKQIASKKRDEITVSWVTDFDGTMYKLQSGNPEDSKASNLLCMSVKLEGYSEIAKAMGDDFIKEIFGDQVRELEIDDGTFKVRFDATLQVDLDTITTEEAGKKLAYDWACFKRTVLSFPVRKGFEGLLAPDKALKALIPIPYRSTETIYCCPDEGKITLVFALGFPDPNDMAIANVFLEEFKVSRRDATLGSAPSVSVTPKAPGELRGTDTKRDKNIVGYLSLSFEDRHVRSPELLEKALDMVFSLRNYMHYHIKCCKGYMHTRMRIRVEDLLKILNRADPTKTEKKIKGR